MIYILITAVAFLMDVTIKRYIDKKYAQKVQHPRLNNRLILEKYYNRGAALNFLAEKPKLMRALHTLLMMFIGICYYRLLRIPGKHMAKTGMALLAGGGLCNLYDRYAKGHVVDYFRINAGWKRLRRIIFNISDFFIFIGAVLTVAGSERK